MGKKHIWRNNDWTSSKFSENDIPKDKRSSTNSINKILKKTIPMHIIIKLLKVNKKKNFIRSQILKRINYINKNKDNDHQRFLLKNYANKKTVK